MTKKQQQAEQQKQKLEAQDALIKARLEKDTRQTLELQALQQRNSNQYEKLQSQAQQLSQQYQKIHQQDTRIQQLLNLPHIQAQNTLIEQQQKIQALNTLIEQLLLQPHREERQHQQEMIELHEQIVQLKKQLAKLSPKFKQVITHLWFYLKLGPEGVIKFGKAIKESSIKTRYEFMKFDRSYKMRIPISALLAAAPKTRGGADTTSHSHFDQQLIINTLLSSPINPQTGKPHQPLIHLIHGREWMRTADHNAVDPQIVLLQFGKRMERANIPEGEAGGKAMLDFVSVLKTELFALYDEIVSPT